MISISSNPHSGIQRFFQDFRLPDYTLDSFSGRLLDVVSSTTFTNGDAETELCHAITRLMFFVCVLKFDFFYQTIPVFESNILTIAFSLYIDCLTYMNQEYVISLTTKLV